MGLKIGDNNKIKNSTIIGGSQINISKSDGEATAPPKKKSFWKGVWQGVFSNLLWWIIGGLIILILGTIAAIKWDDLISLILGR